MNFTNKTFWILLGVTVGTLSMGTSASEVDAHESSSVLEPATSSFLAPVPTSLSHEEIEDLADMLMDSDDSDIDSESSEFQKAKEMIKLMQASGKDILEVIELTQNHEDHMNIKATMAGSCFASDKMDCYKQLDKEIRRTYTVKSRKQKLNYPSLISNALLSLPTARINEPQLEFLKKREGKFSLYLLNDSLDGAIGVLNSGLLKYLIGVFERKSQTPKFDYDSIVSGIAHGYAIYQSSEEDTIASVKLIKTITEFDIEKLREAIDEALEGFASESPEHVGLTAYKETLNKYWNME